MSKKKPLSERIKETEKHLLQLKAQEKLKIQKEKSRAAAVEKRQQFAEAWKLTREKDAHRKIQLGGIVIAVGADKLDPAELCGLLLTALRNLPADRLPALKEIGISYFEARKTARQTQ
ncbi:conjugal transfer protein TraD [Xanthomonas euvesicatoria pv. euvesicatoria]|uniref:Conjugal transfer protein TraD n=3 Tax=Xanthomonas euvesicatoria TaxID=456327 RepID=Q3BWN8_XANE5|nr:MULTISPECIES: conjugal transfer protein TraD [Xanthomonas]MBZ2850797.1 conjugal transfer protein TraD [Xanthomonas perforans]APO91532.1 conjugal transfer protein TraD [Xanthomonas euvesicatoria]ARR16642.1 conjugal transfer protein TraD [Xanthomonas citri pv. citri]ARR22547.1 conjugal transfer protein TraD [Xanthomonas citri pv. citri]MCC8503025.1 conjugal transfer protein TraD [Xanthomonas euvesicatoria pv. euvesicatoria]